MSKIYKRHCDYCGKFYEGRGKQFCCNSCRQKSRYPDPVTRFWKSVEINDLFDCWIWTASKFPYGYGQIWWDGRIQGAHRVAWQIAFGEIPTRNTYHGICVCHKCDNPSCVNPAHLFLGTTADNMIDKAQKGRSAKGEKHGLSKLEEGDVIAIRKLNAEGWTTRKLAKRFGVGQTAIRAITNRSTWKHI